LSAIFAARSAAGRNERARPASAAGAATIARVPTAAVSVLASHGCGP